MLGQNDFLIAALLEDGVIDRAAVDQASRHAVEAQISVPDALVAIGRMTRHDLAVSEALLAETSYVDVVRYEIDIRHCGLMPRSAAESLKAFPLFVIDGLATVGMVNPLDLKAVDQVRSLLKMDVEAVLCEREALLGLIDRAYSLASSGDGDAPRVTAMSLTTGKEPIVAAVNQILVSAIERGVSDVHIGPDEHALHLRYRIDGTLQAQQGPSLAAHGGIVQRLKVMAALDLTQTRRPQDGKFRFTHGDRQVDVRVSIIPTVCGENVVLRLLTGSAQIKGFGELGFAPSDAATMDELLDQPNGIVLVTGPTGSGKTTTLYAALKQLNSPELNIVTIEDPVEIRLNLVRQVQVNTEVGMTFAGALRSILRQDPDVVLVGEIRDEETARIAIQAALTGHLVLSSLHTNDAPGAITRLRNFGVPSFAINSSLLAAVAQRLVKRVCESCAKPDAGDAKLLARFNLKDSPAHLRRGAGCPRCAMTGFRGRAGVYEILKMGTAIQRGVDEDVNGQKLRELAIASGMKPLWMDGLNKASVGVTTLEEVARVAAVTALESTSTEPNGEAAAQAGQVGPRELRKSA